MTFNPSKALPNYDSSNSHFSLLYFSSSPLERYLQSCMGGDSPLSTGPTDKPGSRLSPGMATAVAPCHFCMSVLPMPITHHTLCRAHPLLPQRSATLANAYALRTHSLNIHIRAYNLHTRE
ncbi:hypothetical protein P7K49_017111, partial [Saguinus oedipus]